MPVLVGVGVPVFELVGVADVVPDDDALGDMDGVSGALGDVDGLAPSELDGVGVEEREGESEAVLEDVVVGELVSLLVPLPVAVLLGVVEALCDGDVLVVGETVRVSDALGVPEAEAPLLSVPVGELLSD